MLPLVIRLPCHSCQSVTTTDLAETQCAHLPSGPRNEDRAEDTQTPCGSCSHLMVAHNDALNNTDWALQSACGHGNPECLYRA